MGSDRRIDPNLGGGSQRVTTPGYGAAMEGINDLGLFARLGNLPSGATFRMWPPKTTASQFQFQTLDVPAVSDDKHIMAICIQSTEPNFVGKHFSLHRDTPVTTEENDYLDLDTGDQVGTIA